MGTFADQAIRNPIFHGYIRRPAQPTPVWLIRCPCLSVQEQINHLLETMGFEYAARPSKVFLQVWEVGDVSAELAKWKRKLKYSFGTRSSTTVPKLNGIGPSTVPVPSTPKKILTWPGFQTASTEGEVFSKSAEAPYSMVSHMITPKKSLRRRLIYDGTHDDDDDDNAGRDDADPCEGLTTQTRRSYHHVDDDGAQRIKLTHHISLSKLPKLRNHSEHALKWLRAFIYEMQGTNTSQDCWHVPFELCMEDGASYWIRQLPQATRTRWSQLCEAFINYYGIQYHESAAELKYYAAQQDPGEHICDYIQRLNGYARSANIIYNKGGAAGARHVKPFLTTCCDGDMVANIIPQIFDNIADVEVVINEIMAAERHHREQRNYVQMLVSTNDRRRYFRSTHHGRHSGRNNRIRTRNAKIAEVPEEQLMITQRSEDVLDDYGRTINQSRVSCKSDSASNGMLSSTILMDCVVVNRISLVKVSHTRHKHPEPDHFMVYTELTTTRLGSGSTSFVSRQLHASSQSVGFLSRVQHAYKSMHRAAACPTGSIKLL
ncbi:unnamed protein product [Phytophthora fragariaefolia]|uniref:Unnamed protein product n=1 Tax=Phytophthora fragariaefolia TaxID=1490495 RepID=A0A9W6XDS4_9STRA|nr:unnamed protein product [Phytophthora fragariaefolia]